jgi:integrase
MAGSINKDKKTGKWYFILELGKDQNGKRLQKKKRGFNTKKEAQQALVALENEVNTGTYLEPSTLLLKDYWNEWFKLKKTLVGVQTFQVYEILYNTHILPKLGGYQLSKLKTIHIQSFINELSDTGYSAETIKKIFNILRNSLEHACDIGLCSSNSALKVKTPTKGNKVEMSVWDKNEVNIFLKAAKDDRYFIVFHLALMTGMRQGELLGLRWKDVDLENGILRVAQTLSHDGKMFLEGAKSKASIRTIPLPDLTVKLLKKHKSILSRERLEYGQGYQNNDLVICTQLGTPLNPPNVRRTFKSLIKKADVPLIRFHDMRHTHATLLLAQGVNVKVISERLGHSNIKITLDIYSHILPSMQQEAVRKLNDLIM